MIYYQLGKFCEIKKQHRNLLMKSKLDLMKSLFPLSLLCIVKKITDNSKEKQVFVSTYHISKFRSTEKIIPLQMGREVILNFASYCKSIKSAFLICTNLCI